MAPKPSIPFEKLFAMIFLQQTFGTSFEAWQPYFTNPARGVSEEIRKFSLVGEWKKKQALSRQLDINQ